MLSNELIQFDREVRDWHNCGFCLEGFPSGQRDQTVNLTVLPSKVRILPPPPIVSGFGFNVCVGSWFGWRCGNRCLAVALKGKPAGVAQW